MLSFIAVVHRPLPESQARVHALQSKGHPLCPLMPTMWYENVTFQDLGLGVSIFGSVRFWTEKNNQTGSLFFFEKKPKPNRNRVKPTGFGPVRFGFLFQKTEKTYMQTNFKYFIKIISIALSFNALKP